jgi:hypothetical protein
MNIHENIYLILFLLLSTINFAQTTADINCESELKTIDTEIETQKTVSFRIVFSEKQYTDESFEFSQGIIVISDLNDSLNIDEIIKVIATIGVKNKLTKILAFRTCKSVEFYFNQNKLTFEQTDYLENNLLPIVEIDLNKTLSKKERKKNKRKRDLIEMVSNESCEKLENSKMEKLNAEEFTNIVSSISAEYVEKTQKIYDMSFEESVDQFLNDLTEYIFRNCEELKRLIAE